MQLPTLGIAIPSTFKRYLGILTLALTLVIGLFLAFSVIQPGFNNQKKLFAEWQALKTRKEAMAKTLANLKAINYSQEQERLASVEYLIPTSDDLLENLSLIEFLAKNFGLNVISNKGGGGIGPVANQPKELSGYLIQSTLEGDYLAVRQFLQTLYRARRAIGATSVILAGQEDGLRVTLNATFFFPVAQEKIKVDTLDSAITSLNDEEEKIIQSLKNREIFAVATQSATLGRPNPFAKP